MDQAYRGSGNCSNQPLLEALANWDIAAESDDIRRYFYHYNDVTKIESGAVLSLVGHKGAGKSAVAQWLADVNDPQRVGRCAKLSFRDFKDSPIHGLITNPDDAQDQYKRLWYHVIVLSFIRLTIADPNVSRRLKFYLKWKFKPNARRGLSRIREIFTRGGAINILGTGFTLGERMRGSFLNVADKLPYDKPYYVIFDELDEEYRYAVAHGKLERRYHDGLIGLEKAIVQFHSDMKEKRQQLYPVMMLRTDIYDLLTSGDRNKFRDKTLDISWTENRIKNLLAYRISRALVPDAEGNDILLFQVAWPALFNISSLRREGTTPSAIFTYINDRTFMRPRDFVAFIKYAAKAALNNNSFEGIRLRDLLDAETEYSDYLRREVEDAIGGLEPEFLLAIRAITDVGKMFPSQADLLEAIKNRTSEGIRAKFALSYMLDTLYYYNVVGRHHERLRATYSYMGGGKFSTKWNLMVHKGLWRSLGLTSANMDALREALRGR